MNEWMFNARRPFRFVSLAGTFLVFAVNTTARSLCFLNFILKYQYRFSITCMRPRSRPDKKKNNSSNAKQSPIEWVTQQYDFILHLYSAHTVSCFENEWRTRLIQFAHDYYLANSILNLLLHNNTHNIVKCAVDLHFLLKLLFSLQCVCVCVTHALAASVNSFVCGTEKLICALGK